MNKTRQIAIAAMAAIAFQWGVSFALEAPKIVVGACYRSARTDTDYVRAAAQSLKEHNFNTVVANEAFTREMADLFQEQGIAVISKGGMWLDHVAVIGSMLGEDPLPRRQPGQDVERLRKQYAELSGKTAKPLIACMAGDGLGVDYVNDPWTFWKEVKPRVRCFSWYGIRKEHYGILHRRLYAGYLGFSSVLRISGSGNWVVLPAFGTNERDAEFRNPGPADITGMMHLALAYGARGIIFWALQNHDEWQCLVDKDSLKPVDGKYAAAAAMAARINAHADLLMSLKPAGGDIRCPNSFVEIVGQRDKDDKQYIYVVNKNTKAPVTAKLLWWEAKFTSIRDVFSREELAIAKEPDQEGYATTVSLELAPGEGKLLDWGTEIKEGAKTASARTTTAEAKVLTPKTEPDRALPNDIVYKEGPARARKLLESWMGQGTKWDGPLFGGRLLIDGKHAWQGGGKLIEAHESKNEAFAAWDATSNLDASIPAEIAFVACGVIEKPGSMAILLVDLRPKDGKEHTYEIHLPMAGNLEFVRALAANVSREDLGNGKHMENLRMRYYKYYLCYPGDRANYCADTVLRPPEKSKPGWLICRLIEPGDGPIFPGAYRKSQTTGETDGTLVVSGRGPELRLKLLLFVDNAPAEDEPRIFTVWSGRENNKDLRLTGGSFLKFRTLDTGRTIFTFLNPEFESPAGADDDKMLGNF